MYVNLSSSAAAAASDLRDISPYSYLFLDARELLVNLLFVSVQEMYIKASRNHQVDLTFEIAVLGGLQIHAMQRNLPVPFERAETGKKNT